MAVIGAGISGLTTASILTKYGFEVKVFEKSRGPGGRTATRREEKFFFDHGAQYFTVRDPRFREFVKSCIKEGVVQNWDGRIVNIDRESIRLEDKRINRFTGIPGMNAMAKYLSKNLSVQYQTEIKDTKYDDASWVLEPEDENNYGPFDALLISTPPLQTEPFVKYSDSISNCIQSAKMNPCWAVIAVFEYPLNVAYDGAFIHNSPLRWIARNNSKPRRPEFESWVLHASVEWSKNNIEKDPEYIANRLLTAFKKATGMGGISPYFIKAHRWRYSIAENPLNVGALWDEKINLGVCGDWLKNSRVEGAFLSGLSLADQVKAHSSK